MYLPLGPSAAQNHTLACGGGGGRRGSRAKGDGVGKGRGGVEARRLWDEYRRAVLGTSESVGINRQIDWQLTYLRPSLPVEHRPSTTPRHRTLFWAALAIPDQLVTCCFSSTSVSCLQLLRGRPLFLFPCGLQFQGLARSAGCWLPEGVSDPAPLPPQYLLGHWFLLCFSRVHS